MKFNPQFDLGDIADIVVIIPAVIALILTLIQLRINNKTQRAIFFKDLYSLLFSDSEMRYAFQVIESQSLQYGADFHLSEEAKAIDKLLSHCELVSALYSRGLLSPEEMIHFSYNLKRVYENPNIQRYLHEVIEPWTKHQQLEPGPFAEFRSLGKKGLSPESKT
jgi:hypothetical protein